MLLYCYKSNFVNSCLLLWRIEVGHVDMPVVHTIDEDDDNFSASSPMLFSFMRTTLVEGKLCVRVAEPADYVKLSNAADNDNDTGDKSVTANATQSASMSITSGETSTTTATMSRPGAGGLWSNGFNIDTIGIRSVRFVLCTTSVFKKKITLNCC